ncbi:tetratricopeptide repeat protein [Marivita sp. XM-24bin2]|jgi:tetratricopeptide (TPR) repeat protein|uniref:tetratricopeptide repeat protein n=1 Tax=unclassified Marivita TaxID=2632480 RepID=UPI0025BC1637|nr:tetratricopeptide repeat protein [Marivita sp. XM-24bin2]MCR9108648.1 hypothetical protein [Paracoccaceae bacterium]
MRKYKSAVAAFLLTMGVTLGAAHAQPSATADLLDELAQAEDERAAERLERQVRQEWSKSGSAAIDLLLKRGEDALEVDNVDVALEHLRAVTDHAPDFAEGWHALALAYYRKEMFGPAADALERTLALNPKHFGALRGLGAIFEQVDKPHLAYDAYSRVLSLRPHDSDVLDALERLELRVNGQTL